MQTMELNPMLRRAENKLDLGEWMLVILTFIVSTNLINQFFLISTGLFIVAALYYALDIKMNKSTAVLFMFAISNMIGCMVCGSVLLATLIRPFYFVMFFILGKTISKDGNRKMSVYMILAMVFGAATHGIANFVMNYMEFGMNSGIRNMPDIWTREILAATGQGALFAPFAGTVFYGLFNTKKIVSKLLFVAIFVCMCMYNMMTASRTVFVILFISVAMCLIANIRIKKGNVRIVLSVFMVIAAIYVAYMVNLFGFKDFIEETALKKRMESIDGSILETERGNIILYYLKNLHKSVFGGRYIMEEYGTYAHNLFLDLYDTAGVPALLFLVWFYVVTFKKLFKLMKFNFVDTPFKILVFGVMLSIFLQSMTEPILDGMPWMFAMFCTISGIIDSIYEYAKGNGI